VRPWWLDDKERIGLADSYRITRVDAVTVNNHPHVAVVGVPTARGGVWDFAVQDVIRTISEGDRFVVDLDGGEYLVTVVRCPLCGQPTLDLDVEGPPRPLRRRH
jgi:hypothetical protein